MAALCDRRRGLGADGRVTTAAAAAAAGVLDRLPDGVAGDDWYMDYRNADGSVAQMCGNGVRVFAHYLRASGLETRDEFVVGSLAGPRPVTVHAADATGADVSVDMGKANTLGGGGEAFEATVGGRLFAGLAVDVGNPHLACLDPELSVDELAALDVAAPVSFDAAQFPDGVNIEVLTAPAAGVVHMRVHERGVGETRCRRRRRHRHPDRAGTGRRRRGHRHRRHQLPARAVGAGGPRRNQRGMVAASAALIQVHATEVACIIFYCL